MKASMTLLTRRLPLVILLALTACLVGSTGGCGYGQSGGDFAEGGGDGGDPQRAAGAGGYKWRSVYREDVRTVAVPIFTNKTFAREAEFALSKAIVTQLEAHSPYKVIDRDRADTVLEGEITNVTVRTISTDPRSSVPQEQLYRVRVNFIWKDLRTGRILVDRRHFEQTAPYYPTLGEGRFVGSQVNLERLALGIVQELQADW